VNGIDELKQHLIAVWDGFGHSVIDNSIIDEWCGACVCAKGRHFQNLMRFQTTNLQTLKADWCFCVKGVRNSVSLIFGVFHKVGKQHV